MPRVAASRPNGPSSVSDTDAGATSSTRAEVSELTYRLDVNTLHRDSGADHLALNEIGRVWLHLREPMMFDAYARNRETGSFILVDLHTNRPAKSKSSGLSPVIFADA